MPTGAAGYESVGWTATFVNLPMYKIVDGAAVEIEYTVAETTTYPGYTADTTDPVASGSTITNTQVPTTANALKAWENADGTTTAPASASVVFTLYADGTATDYTVTLDGTVDTAPEGAGGYESAAWVATFVNLPKYHAGTTTEIVYTVAETTTYPGYTVDPEGEVESGSTIKNKQGSTETYALKAWKNADGTTTAPTNATVVFTLYADGTATEYTVTLDGTVDTAPAGTGGYESEAWKAEFVNLPKSKIVDGAAVDIVYTVKETTTYPGYTASPDGEVASGSTITNEQEPTTANALKAWVNADGTTEAPQGGQVTYTLYADGEATEYTVTLDGTVDTAPTVTGGYESEAWKAEFVNLPKYKAGTTTVIKYTVAETGLYPGYTASTAKPVASGETITNTQEPTSANALKAWVNADGTATAPEGATVVFTLYADGTATEYTVTLDGTKDAAPTGTAGYESAAWKAEFVNLPKYRIEEGEAVEIVYTVAETTTYPGYTPSATDPVASGETITNTQVPTTADATKAWVNADGTTKAPEGATVVFTLYADGTATGYTVTLDGTKDETVPTKTGGYESAAWVATFVNLPKYKAGTTTEIKYTVAETKTYPGYTASTTGAVASGETITNTQESNSANATKAWKNADGTTKAPEGATVVFTLYADGEATGYTVTLDGTVDTAPTGTAGYESEAWKAEFINLPKYKIGTTTEIKYTVAETTTYPGYTASATEPVASGSTITNEQVPTTANALKAWVNADGTTAAPTGATVVFTLYADGTATGYTVTLDGAVDTKPEGTAGYESEAWKAEFINLPKYRIENGEAVEIVYTVAETTTYPGYTPSATGAVASGETITNTQVPTTANALKAWVNADGSTTPPAGLTVEFTLYADGAKTNYAVTLDGTPDTEPTGTAGYESEAWKAEFINLPKYKAGTTTEIVYTVAETVTVEGYTASTTEPVASGNTITNTQDKKNITVIKEWDDLPEHVDLREKSVTVNLMVEKVGSTEGPKVKESVELSDANDWTYTWENLPEYEVGEKSVKLNYSITEDKVKGYTGEPGNPVVDEDGNWTITVTNTINERPEATPAQLKVYKVDQDGLPLEGAGFTLENANEDKLPEAITGENGYAYITIPVNSADEDGKMIDEGWLGWDERIQDEYNFTLEETTVPNGYDEPDPKVWNVKVVPEKAESGEYEYKVEYDLVENDTVWRRLIHWIVDKFDEEYEDNTLVVTNKASAQKVVVTKSFEGLNALPDSFAIKVSYTDYNAENHAVTNTYLYTDASKITDKNVTVTTEGNKVTWTISNVRFGTRVTTLETGYTVQGYGVTASAVATDGEETVTNTATGEEFGVGIDSIPAAAEGEAAATFDYTNIYEYHDLILIKDLPTYVDHEGLTSSNETETPAGASFVFRIKGYDAAEGGNLVLDTVAGIDLSAPGIEQTLLEKISPDVVRIEVEETYTGNYTVEPVEGKTTRATATLVTDPENQYRKYFEVSFKNNWKGNVDYKTGITNRYEKTPTGGTQIAGETQGGNDQG